jgi:hypothetical protein
MSTTERRIAQFTAEFFRQLVTSHLVVDGTAVRRKKYIYLDHKGSITETYTIIGEALERTAYSLTLRPDANISMSDVAGQVMVSITFSL